MLLVACASEFKYDSGEIVMNIKIITCHYAYNYGAVLQTYALCRFLNDQGESAEVINYRPWYYKGSTKNKNKIRLALRKIIRLPDNYKSEKVFYSFLKRNVPMTVEYKDYDSLVQADIKADVFIAGSDQIWNFNMPNGREKAFYLEFVRQGKKTSYAASLGMDALMDEQMLFLREKLKQFDYISLRESSAKRIFEVAGIQDVQVVLDPVYLLRHDEWSRFSRKPQIFPEEKYILVYAFNRQREIFRFGEKLAKKYGYKLLTVNTFWEDVLNTTDHYYWNCMPEEFVYLVRHAECVVTNSFHGLSFSIIFNRPAILFEKDETGNSRMNDLIDMLEAYKVKDQTVKDRVIIPDMDFSAINKNIQKYREQSIRYLSLLTREEG